MMPVKDHCEMLTCQLLLNTHPNTINLNHRAPRKMKNTLVTEHGKYIKKLTKNNNHTGQNHKKLLKKIHTDSVARTISNQAVNPVLNTCTIN